MRQFLQQTFASLVGSLAGLILFFSLATSGFLFLLIAVASKDTGPQVQDKSVLVFDLSVNISDTNPTSSTSEVIEEVLSGQQTNIIPLRKVLDTLDKATKDKRIVALYLDGSASKTVGNTGLANLKEVREALERFRAAGKKIIAYDVDLGEREYYLSSVADTIILNPMGVIEINGLNSSQLFLTGALQKYGIGVQVVRVGKYKSAVEPFLLKQLSSESREQTRELLDDIWDEFLTTVGKSREITPKTLQAIANSQGMLIASEAKRQGLVDQVGYFDEVITTLKELTGEKEKDKSFRKIKLATYARAKSPYSKNRKSKHKIAVVYAEGSIVDGQGNLEQVGGKRFAKQLRELRLDKDIKAVVLRVNSPGGSATASEIIQREVRLIREEKPVIVSMGNVAASGGYWISTYSDRIFAEPNTITGSIGVFGVLFNIQELANNNGLTWDIVQTASLADIQSTVRPKTDQELAIYQTMVNQIYDQFIDKVAESRKLPKGKVKDIAQGRVWSGIDAKQIGLVDEIGGINHAIEYAAKQAKLKDDWKVEEYPKNPSFEERILETLTNDVRVTSRQLPEPLTTELLKLKDDLAILTTLNDPKGIYSILPFNWRFD
ncbi:signal peptide peptidase SppA [Moorena producens PAL-8-15-08-1]|uniref:Protease 4 n=1 Tax=Moorena producens PAL-8-15-08-1 TaxID=1458985 RepID=A0A1D8TR25_9CYAN|nr:signal peptide peptidase SppA [Moorena producens]AOX00023.1 signal peptide peptidase SppA [Moorena producens PAL-8-15-08-1]